MKQPKHKLVEMAARAVSIIASRLPLDVKKDVTREEREFHTEMKYELGKKSTFGFGGSQTLAINFIFHDAGDGNSWEAICKAIVLRPSKELLAHRLYAESKLNILKALKADAPWIESISFEEK
jgi:hypothetical protein